MPLFSAGPLPPPHLKGETPKGRDRRVGVKPGAPAATTALRPCFSSHPTTCLPWALVLSHASAGVLRDKCAAVYLEKRVWGRLGHGG